MADQGNQHPYEFIKLSLLKGHSYNTLSSWFVTSMMTVLRLILHLIWANIR